MKTVWILLPPQHELDAGKAGSVELAQVFFSKSFAEQVAARRLPKQRVVEVELDEARDKREAEAIDHVLASWTGPDWLASENDRAREVLEELRERLKGGVR